MTKKTICKHIGHTVKFFDSGYCVCDRCGSHEYYHPTEWGHAWHTSLYRVLVRLWNGRERFNAWRAEQERKRRVDNGDFPF